MSGIDECPVRGCGGFIPGLDPAEMFDGSDCECERGHRLLVVVGDDRMARLEPDRFPCGRLLPRAKWATGKAR